MRHRTDSLKAVSILAVALCVISMMLLQSCGSARQLKSESQDKATMLLSDPPLTGFSARASVALGSNSPFTVSVRTRWDEIIQISYNALGLVEIAVVELTPDKIILISRVNRIYSELPFSQVPYINDLKADFRTVQGLLWGRMSVYRIKNPAEAVSHVSMLRNGRSEEIIFVDDASDFRYTIDTSDHVVSVSKSILLYKASIDYSSFNGIPGSFQMPQILDCHINYGLKSLSAKVRYRNLSVQNGAVSRNDLSGLRRVGFSEMLDMIKSLI